MENQNILMEYEKVIGMFSSEHDQDCCENHYLDFEGTEEVLETAKQFLSKVDKIEIKGVEGMGIIIRMYDENKEFGIFLAGRGYNNGYYGINIELIVKLPSLEIKRYDVSDYQTIEE